MNTKLQLMTSADAVASSAICLRVFVYWNLHRGQWSVKALEGPNKGRVIAHVPSIELFGCEFKVSEAGRQRVIREQRKNVHAGVVGYVSPNQDDERQPDSIRYNPYKWNSFVRFIGDYSLCTIVSVKSANRVSLHADRTVTAFKAH